MTARESVVRTASPCPARQRSITAAGLSDVGSVRSHNEDSYVIAELEGGTAEAKGSGRAVEVRDGPMLLMVADGVGGAASGEIASLMATDIVLTELRERLGHPAQPEQRGVGAEIPAAMRGALQAANSAIYSHAASNSRHRGMATTATVAVVHAQTLFLAQIGDSRAYLVRGSEARQLTKDQSLIQRLIDVGELTEVEAAASERRNIILQAVGSEPVLAPELSSETLLDGDVVILCSDGLSNLVPATDIAHAANESPHLAQLCQTLVDRANERGGDDNITVVAARYSGAPDDRATCDSTVPTTGTAPHGSQARSWWTGALAIVVLAVIAIAMRACRY